MLIGTVVGSISVVCALLLSEETKGKILVPDLWWPESGDVSSADIRSSYPLAASVAGRALGPSSDTSVDKVSGPRELLITTL